MTAQDAVLLTGASGFIGASVMQTLRTAAPRRALIVAGRSIGGATSPIVQRFHLDLTALGFELPKNIGTVLHLAGEKRDAASMWAVNHLGTVRLVEAAARAGARCFVHLSSVGVYGAPRHARVVDEHYQRTPRSIYESSKEAGERAVRERCAALGMRCIVLQPSNVLGVVPGRSYPLLGLVRMIGRGWFRFFGR